ncbi:MAG: hypothetical protein NWF10_05195 [Candidatus Bathyarchaeota archaeon]|nr:hypothetical protein [Candidatus Bathyarchaeota archaeon]
MFQFIKKTFKREVLEAHPLEEILRDMTLDEDSKNIFTETLHNVLTFDVSKVKDSKNKEIYFTLISCNGIKRFLCQIPNIILALDFRDSSEFWDVMDRIALSFKKGSLKNKNWKTWNKKIYIVHYGEPAISIAVEDYTLNDWPDIVGIQGKYISFHKSVNQLNAERREELLRRQLELDQSPELLGEITHNEKKKLAEIIATFNEFHANAMARSTFVNQIPGFSKWTGIINFDGPIEPVAKQLIQQIIDRSIEHEDNAFGKFIYYLLQMGKEKTMSNSHKIFIKNIIDKYQLTNKL